MSNILQWVLGLETAPFAKGIDSSAAKLKHFEKQAHAIKMPDFGKEIGRGLGSFGADSLKSLAAPLLATVGAVGSVAAVMDGLKGSLELGDKLEKISSQTGMGVESVVMLKKAFQDADIDVEKLGSSTNKMQKFLAGAAAGGEGGGLLRSMGLDPQTLASAKPEETFEKIGAAINALPNPTERAAAAMQIFGKSGGELLAVFSSESFRNAGNISNTARILGENAAAFKEANEALNHVGGKLQGFFAGMASSFVPALLPLLEKFEKMDFSSWGVKLGNIIGNFSTNWTDELTKITQFLADALALVLSGDGLKAFGEGLVAEASRLGDALIKAFNSPLNWLEAGMQHAVEMMMQGLGKIPGVGKAMGLSGYTASSLDTTLKEVEARGNGVKNLTKDNAGNRPLVESNLRERLARLKEKALASLHPVIAATVATDNANKKGRASADEKITKGFQGDWNSNDLGGKHSGGGGVITGSFNADAFAASMRYRGTGGAGDGSGMVGSGVSSPSANPLLDESRSQTRIQSSILVRLEALFSLAQHPTATLVMA